MCEFHANDPVKIQIRVFIDSGERCAVFMLWPFMFVAAQGKDCR